MKYDCSKCEASFECKMTLACREENDNPETIFWHPFPKEKPKKTPYPRVLLVTYYEEFDLERFLHVATALFDGEFNGIIGSDVVAWAEMPKPYMEDLTKEADNG